MGTSALEGVVEAGDYYSFLASIKQNEMMMFVQMLLARMSVKLVVQVVK